MPKDASSPCPPSSVTPFVMPFQPPHPAVILSVAEGGSEAPAVSDRDNTAADRSINHSGGGRNPSHTPNQNGLQYSVVIADCRKPANSFRCNRYTGSRVILPIKPDEFVRRLRRRQITADPREITANAVGIRGVEWAAGMQIHRRSGGP
jgi:hypothetical protein